MMLDERTEFADNIAFNTGGVAEYLIGDVIDLTNTGEDLGGGGGNPIYVVIIIDTAPTGTGLVRFKVVSDAAAAIATDGSATEHVVTHDFDVDVDLTQGTRLVLPLPGGEQRPYERFLGILQETITSAITAGNFSAFITRDVGTWKSYPDALN